MKLDIRDRRTQLGIALVVLGVLALFGDLGLFAGIGRLFGVALFGVAAFVVLRLYREDEGRVWALPTGFGLIGLALASLDTAWSGGAFLGSLGLGFLAVWAVKREHWWALIPAGTLMTLGLVATFDEVFGGAGDFAGTLFFLGLTATFAALYLLPSVNQSWAIWPALGLGVIAVLTLSFQGGWIVPIVLIGLGAWLLTRQSRPADVQPVPPPAPGEAPAAASSQAPAPRSPVEPSPEPHAPSADTPTADATTPESNTSAAQGAADADVGSGDAPRDEEDRRRDA